MNYLAPSILSADFARLGEDVELVEKQGLKKLHIDVMDGMFVPSISLGMPVIQSIRKGSDMFFDVHLMIEQPERYIDTFAQIGADGITVHAEACKHLHRQIQQIRAAGKKVGVALNPATPLSSLDYVLGDVDMVLIMTVNPGFGGQKFIPAMFDKISTLRERINREGLNIDIEVDGGVSAANIKQISEAGANVFVAGSSVYGEDPAARIAQFRQVMPDLT